MSTQAAQQTVSAIVHVAGLDFRYAQGDFRLHVPQLMVDRGTTAAVIGPSGSGKTTLLNLLAGIAVPQAGRITVNDVEVTALSDADRRAFRISNIGLVFQEFELLEYLSVLDNILLPYRINSCLRLDRAVRDRACELAERTGIQDKLRRFARRLSQGERQRVAVCRSLLPQPSLLMADEPTGNLDPANRDRVLEVLFGYVRDTGATLLAVTHDHDQLDRFEQTIDFAAVQAHPDTPSEAGGRCER